MAWTAPITAVANAVFTAAQFNATVRDNLNETAPAKATAAGQLFVSTGVNAIAARTPTAASVLTSETTASSTYVALTTPGPVVGPLTTGSQAIVFVGCQASNNTANGSAVMGYAITGATTLAASDNDAVQTRTASGGNEVQRASAVSMAPLTPGSNTFTAQYHTNGTGTATFTQRTLIVLPL